MIVVFVAVVVVALRSWPGPRHTRALPVAALACWIGALFADFVQAQLMRLGLNRSVEGVIEEGFELVGALLFLISVVEVLRTVGGCSSTARSRSTATGHSSGLARWLAAS